MIYLRNWYGRALVDVLHGDGDFVSSIGAILHIVGEDLAYCEVIELAY